METISYVIITPVRDEAEYLGGTIDSVKSQTIRPLQWIIVNDGSTDGTANIIDAAAKECDWIIGLHRPDRGYREAGTGVVSAFYDGYRKVDPIKWEFIVKLDGDISFEPIYFEKCLRYFAFDPSLGIGGGTVVTLRNGELKVDSPTDPPFHVRGASKIYRRGCWSKISPLVRAPGWDTIDEVKANYYGWTTRTFGDLKVIQHKPTGGGDGHWRDWFKNGRANYITGYHPLFMLAKCFKRAFQRIPLAESIALSAGFWSGYLKGIEQIEDRDVVRYLRRQQIRRLLMQSSIYG